MHYGKSTVSVIAILNSVILLLLLIFIFCHYSLLLMVHTKSQLDNLSKEKPIEELTTVDCISNSMNYQIDLMIF